MKKFFAALLASTMLFTAAAAALPPPIAASATVQNSLLASHGELSFAEFIRALIVSYDGKEQPIIMDAHYAMPYVNRAVSLGLIADSDSNTWNENVSRDKMNDVLKKASELENADIEKITDAVNALLVDKIIINDKELDCPIVHRNGSIMLPVRAISEALGYTVSWNQNEYTATVNTGKITSDVHIGTNLYCYTSVAAIGMSKPSPLASSPLLIDKTTYVPLDFFNLISVATIDNGIITIK